MSSRTSYSEELKLRVRTMLLEGDKTFQQVADEVEVEGIKMNVATVKKLREKITTEVKELYKNNTDNLSNAQMVGVIMNKMAPIKEGGIKKILGLDDNFEPKGEGSKKSKVKDSSKKVEGAKVEKFDLNVALDYIKVRVASPVEYQLGKIEAEIKIHNAAINTLRKDYEAKTKEHKERIKTLEEGKATVVKAFDDALETQRNKNKENYGDLIAKSFIKDDDKSTEVDKPTGNLEPIVPTGAEGVEEIGVN